MSLKINAQQWVKEIASNDQRLISTLIVKVAKAIHQKSLTCMNELQELQGAVKQEKGLYNMQFISETLEGLALSCEGYCHLQDDINILPTGLSFEKAINKVKEQLEKGDETQAKRLFALEARYVLKGQSTLDDFVELMLQECNHQVYHWAAALTQLHNQFVVLKSGCCTLI